MSSHLFSLTRFRHTIPLSNLSPRLRHNAFHLQAHQLFDKMPQRNPLSYDSIIAADCRNGHVDEAYALLRSMLAHCHRPSSFTFVPILSSGRLDTPRAVQLHTLLLKLGLLHSDPYSATALMGQYVNNRRMVDAVQMFDEIPDRTVVTWNSIIFGFARMGCVQNCVFLFRELLRSGIRPSDCSLLGILTACRRDERPDLLEQVHGVVIKLAMDCYTVVCNALFSAYSDCFAGSVLERLFCDLPVKDLDSWNTHIIAFARSENPERALKLFARMLFEGVYPDENTLASVLVACSGANFQMCGEVIHAKAFKHNLNTSVYVGSSLVDFYAKRKRLEDAHTMFSEIPDKNVVTWNALISGYSNDSLSILLNLFKVMLHSGFRPNEFTFSSVLRKAEALALRQLHSLITKMGYENYDCISSALIASYNAQNMISDALACSSTLVSPDHVVPCNVIAGIYNKMGRYEDAKDMLLQLQYPDSISGNILVAACARNADYTEGFHLFKRMQISGYLLDNYMAVSLLSMCSKINNLKLGGIIHGLIIKANAGCSEIFVSNLLMDMYAKCGSLGGCLRVFHEMQERNIISWTSLISALGLHGCTHEALKRFRQMESEGLKPDKVAFLAVLSACRHSGYVEQGKLLFEKMMSAYAIEPEMDHYIIIVDLLCRYGHLKEAEETICGMPFQPTAVIWRIFLQGCKMHRLTSPKFGK